MFTTRRTPALPAARDVTIRECCSNWSEATQQFAGPHALCTRATTSCVSSPKDWAVHIGSHMQRKRVISLSTPRSGIPCGFAASLLEPDLPIGDNFLVRTCHWLFCACFSVRRDLWLELHTSSHSTEKKVSCVIWYFVVCKFTMDALRHQAGTPPKPRPLPALYRHRGRKPR